MKKKKVLLKPGFQSKADNFAAVSIMLFIKALNADNGNASVVAISSEKPLIAFTRFIWRTEDNSLYLSVPRAYEGEFDCFNRDSQKVSIERLAIRLKPSEQILKEQEQKIRAAANASSHRQDFLMTVYPYSVFAMDSYGCRHRMSPQLLHKYKKFLDFIEKFMRGMISVGFENVKADTIIEMPDSLKKELADIG